MRPDQMQPLVSGGKTSMLLSLCPRRLWSSGLGLQESPYFLVQRSPDWLMYVLPSIFPLAAAPFATLNVT